MEEDNSTEEHSIKKDHLIKELHQLYSFVNAVSHDYIVWNTVFTTVTFTVLGFLLLKNTPQNIVIVMVSFFMLILTTLGILGSIQVKNRIKLLNEKALLIGKIIDVDKTQLVGTLLSDGFYEKIFWLLILALVLWLIVWIAYPFILIYF